VYYLQVWLKKASIHGELVFRRVDWTGAALKEGLSGYWIARVVQRYVLKAGINPKLVAAHSLHLGLVTSAGEMNAPIYKIIGVNRQKKTKMVLRYLRV
jgi:hypothetical protein